MVGSLHKDQLNAVLCLHILLLLFNTMSKLSSSVPRRVVSEAPLSGWMERAACCWLLLRWAQVLWVVVVVVVELCWANLIVWTLLYPNSCRLFLVDLFPGISNDEILCFPPSLNFIMKVGLESGTLLYHLMN